MSAYPRSEPNSSECWRRLSLDGIRKIKVVHSYLQTGIKFRTDTRKCMGLPLSLSFSLFFPYFLVHAIYTFVFIVLVKLTC